MNKVTPDNKYNEGSTFELVASGVLEIVEALERLNCGLRKLSNQLQKAADNLRKPSN